jgi:hypothetical protein
MTLRRDKTGFEADPCEHLDKQVPTSAMPMFSALMLG